MFVSMVLRPDTSVAVAESFPPDTNSDSLNFALHALIAYLFSLLYSVYDDMFPVIAAAEEGATVEYFNDSGVFGFASAYFQEFRNSGVTGVPSTANTREASPPASDTAP